MGEILALGRLLRDAWIVTWLLITVVGVRLTSVATVDRLLGVYARGGIWGRDAIDADSVGRRIQRLGSMLPFIACLEEAVVCHAILEANELESELNLGVTKPARNTLVAHAWVTVDDRVIVGDMEELSEYSLLAVDRLQ